MALLSSPRQSIQANSLPGQIAAYGSQAHLESGFHGAQTSVESFLLLKMNLNSRSSCLSSPCAGVTDITTPCLAWDHRQAPHCAWLLAPLFCRHDPSILCFTPKPSSPNYFFLCVHFSTSSPQFHARHLGLQDSTKDSLPSSESAYT